MLKGQRQRGKSKEEESERRKGRCKIKEKDGAGKTMGMTLKMSDDARHAMKLSNVFSATGRRLDS